MMSRLIFLNKMDKENIDFIVVLGEKSYGEYETYSGSGTKCFGNSRG